MTGWIPERISIDTSDPTFAKDKIFNMLVSKHNKGDVLITIATGVMSEAEADRAGLVPTHAYAVLDIREVLVCLLYVVNCLCLLLSKFEIFFCYIMDRKFRPTSAVVLCVPYFFGKEFIKKL